MRLSISLIMAGALVAAAPAFAQDNAAPPANAAAANTVDANAVTAPADNATVPVAATDTQAAAPANDLAGADAAPAPPAKRGFPWGVLGLLGLLGLFGVRKATS